MRFASAANLKLGEILGGVSSAPSTSTIFFHTREETSIKLILFPIIWHFSITNFVLSLTKILQIEKLRWEVKIPGGNRRILNSVEGQGRALYREILHPLHIYTGIFDSLYSKCYLHMYFDIWHFYRKYNLLSISIRRHYTTSIRRHYITSIVNVSTLYGGILSSKCHFAFHQWPNWDTMHYAAIPM